MALLSAVLLCNVCRIFLIDLSVVDESHTSTGVVYGGLVVPVIKLVVLQDVVGLL